MRVATSGPEWADQAQEVARGMRLAAELNKLGFDDAARIRELFGELTGRPVDEGFRLIPPFYTAGGGASGSDAGCSSTSAAPSTTWAAWTSATWR